MKYYYDLHIHSSLSPCGDEDMTPNNIVNMAILKGLDIIAVTDHNAAGNVEVIMKRGARKQLIVVPGIEIESAEDVHILALFPDADSCLATERSVREALPFIKNRAEIFGRQLLMDEVDEITGDVENLLITATKLSIEEVFNIVDEVGGIAIPAHVDRDSYSILSNLGGIPKGLPVKNIELSENCDMESFLSEHSELGNFGILRNSDAHYLWDISERNNYIETEQKITDAQGVIKLLRGLPAYNTL